MLNIIKYANTSSLQMALTVMHPPPKSLVCVVINLYARKTPKIHNPPPSMIITDSDMLGSLSTKFSSVSVGICTHLVRRAFVSHALILDEKA